MGEIPYGVLIRHGQHTDLEWLIETRENKYEINEVNRSEYELFTRTIEVPLPSK